jgi:hypothetical protein
MLLWASVGKRWSGEARPWLVHAVSQRDMSIAEMTAIGFQPMGAAFG